MLARFVGLMFILYGLLLTVTNVIELIEETEHSGSWWVYPWVIGSGLVSLAAGTLFTLTIDGPPRFVTRNWRTLAIALMLLAALLPTSLTSVVIVLAVIMVPSLWLGLPGPESEDSSIDD